MINLELLEILTLAIAAVALWRFRPVMVVIAGSQLMTLRALANIRDYGQPASEWQNPAALFSLQNVAKASHLFAISTLILLAFTLIKPRASAPKPVVLPAVPRWILALIVLFSAVIITSSNTIFEYGRSDPDRIVSGFGYSFDESGLATMLYSVLLYELYRRAVTGLLKPIWAFLWIVLLFTLTDYLKGQTGLATGYVACAAILILGAASGAPSVRKRVTLGLVVMAFMLVAATVRSVRQDLWQDGWGAVTTFSSSLLGGEDARSRTSEGLESFGNGTQYAAHVLEGIALYDSGASRRWQSFVDPLITTVEPSFLVGPLGLTRPVNAAVELQHVFVSGGGDYILGELYWNGGYPCVALGFLLLTFWAFLCDTRYRQSAFWLMLTCQFAPSFLEGVGYGLSHSFRCWFDGFLVISVYQGARWARRAVASHQSGGKRLPLGQSIESAAIRRGA
jgi:hypothetical protein